MAECKMYVQTVKTRTLYGGDKTRALCQSCSNAVEGTIQSNASTNYFSYLFEAQGDWHEGICDEHEYHQAVLDRQGKWR